MNNGRCAYPNGSATPYVATGQLLFHSPETYQASCAPHAEKTIADIPKYTNSSRSSRSGKSSSSRIDLLGGA